MDSKGIVRRVDDLGRIVIPIEIRKTLGISVKEPVEIYTEKDVVILKKYQPACIICGNGAQFVVFHDKRVCSDCIKAITGRTQKKGIQG